MNSLFFNPTKDLKLARTFTTALIILGLLAINPNTASASSSATVGTVGIRALFALRHPPSSSSRASSGSLTSGSSSCRRWNIQGCNSVTNIQQYHIPRTTGKSQIAPAFSNTFLRRRVGGSGSTTIAAIMTPEIDGKEKSQFLSNWRDVPRPSNENIDNDGIAFCSPFCHPNHNTSASASMAGPSLASATAAPWSPTAYQSALDLYDNLQSFIESLTEGGASDTIGTNGTNETHEDFVPQLKSALHDLEMAYRLYGPYNMVGSYNGGKDAVVIFHLMRAVHARYCRDQLVELKEMREKNVGYDIENDSDHGIENSENGFMIPRPRVIYFQHPDEFPQVLSLLHETIQTFDVDMLAFEEGVSFAEGLKYLVERNWSPGSDGLSYYGRFGRGSNESDGKSTSLPLPPTHPLAFILGTRKNDPNAGSQGVYAPSSHYMPPFLRVNPILHWNYGHVWHFLRTFNLPYCSLYDEGYTSLGTIKDTFPCPALKKEESDTEFWPAYMLKDWSLERAGRVPKKKECPKKESTLQEAKKKTDANSVEDALSAMKENGASVQKESSRKFPNVTMSATSSTVSLAAKDIDSSIHSNFSSNLSIRNEANVTSDQIINSEGLANLPPTVALIVIGDELLKGLTPDSNILAAAKSLRSHNCLLTRVSIISDDANEIIDEIRRVKDEVDVIITSGGVGPTHDDVTIHSVARALGTGMEEHAGMAELLLEKMCKDEPNDGDRGNDSFSQLPEGMRKMALLPSGSSLQYFNKTKDEWPLLQVENIFILPGVPAFFEKKVQLLAANLYSVRNQWRSTERDVGMDLMETLTSGMDAQEISSPAVATTYTAMQSTCANPPIPPRSVTFRMVLSIEENSIVQALNASVAAHPHVSFGSYPLVDHPVYKTIITLEGRFYNGGYTKRTDETERILDKSPQEFASSSTGKDGREMLLVRKQSFLFSKEEMDKNVQLAMEDLMSRLPDSSIVSVDNIDDLNIVVEK